MNLLIDEPPPWYFPIRQALGTVLPEAGQIRQAEAVFRKDLFKNAENPWSLFGLALTQKKAGHAMREADAMKQFRKAWSRADLELTRPVL
jgi:hypothetical protein